jgi:protein CpxP
MNKIVTALASSLLIGSACAASPATNAPAAPASATTAPMAKADMQRDMKVDKHIKELHAQLKITAAEEPQWAAVAKTMHENATDIDVAIDKREQGAPNATAIDDLNSYGEIAQAHADAVKKLSAAFAPLYESMPDDQKKLADSIFSQHGHAAKGSATAMK